MSGFVPIASSGLIALQVLAGGDSAISREARSVHQAASEVAGSAEQSIALFGKKNAALSELAALASECATQGWDGQDGAPLDPNAVMSSQRFVRLLPETVPLPEFAPEPDGSISLDWMASRNRLFSLSIGRSNRLAFAWLDGSDRGHGVVHFDGQRIPSRILEGIRDIVGVGDAGLRAA